MPLLHLLRQNPVIAAVKDNASLGDAANLLI